VIQYPCSWGKDGLSTKMQYNNRVVMASDYFIGLPQWKHPQWINTILSDREQPELSQYAASFSSVEGNTTFYGLPTTETVQRWYQQTPDGFRFCFKFPQAISHQSGLQHCEQALLETFRQLAPLEHKLGMLCLQLPARFGPSHLPQLAGFLQTLPAGFRYAVEVRHPAFFDGGEAEKQLNGLLHLMGVNRTMFDTRALFATTRTDPVTREALQQKPQLPLRVLATGDAPMLRFITPLHWQEGTEWLQPWVDKLLQWLDAGKTPFVFMHTPSNAEAPELARWLAQQLEQQRPGLKGFVDWKERPRARQRQPGLF